MQNKNLGGVVIAFIVGILIGYLFHSANIKSMDQGAAARNAMVAGKVEVAPKIDPAVLQAAIDANPEAEEVTVRDVNGKIVTQPVPKKLFLMGGADSQTSFSSVLNSLNGSLWNPITANAPWGPRDRQYSVYFKNKIWVIGGGNSYGGSYLYNDVWSSPDGTNWTQSNSNPPWFNQLNFSVLPFQNKMWIIGGYKNGTATMASKVWSSSNGTNWSAVSLNTPFTPRLGHASVVFQNKMWIIGGVDDPNVGNTLSDVWSSPDGTNWTQVTSNAPFASDINSLRATVYKNKIWVFAAASCCNTPIEIYSSPDGINWTHVNAIPANQFQPRVHYSVFTLNNKIWVAGGAGIQVYNDTWSSSNGLNWTQETSSLTTTGVFDHSLVKTPATFGNLCDPASSQVMKVISPNGGETFHNQQQINVTWSSCASSLSTVNIILAYYQNGGTTMTNAVTLLPQGTTPNDGSETVTVDYGLLGLQGTSGEGKFYKIFVTDGGSPWGAAIQDSSDNLFTIRGQFQSGCTSYQMFSTTTGLPCFIETKPVTNITSTTATLNGYMYDKLQPAGVNCCSVGFTVTPSVGGLSGSIQSTPGPTYGYVVGLTPNTTYQVQMCYDDYWTGCANAVSFTTLP